MTTEALDTVIVDQEEIKPLIIKQASFHPDHRHWNYMLGEYNGVYAVWLEHTTLNSGCVNIEFYNEYADAFYDFTNREVQYYQND